jgi:tetratricopeptide (TPR) repeat protein
LAKLDNIPVDERSGDYYLLRAQILDSMGKTKEAAESLNRGIRAAPTRSDMYFQAAAFLIKHHQRQEAVGLLADATRRLPDRAELLMARAIVLELLKRSDEALQALAQMQSRWPEWDLPYLINGIILQNELKPAEARQMLDIAIALGTREADAYYYEALAITTATPDNLAEAQKAISQALALNAEDPAIRVLAGKIFLDRKDYNGAVEQLLAAVQLQPSMVRAHYLLRTAYRDLGDTDKAANELKQIERITKENADPDQLSSSMERLLFGVRPPVRSLSLQ